MISPGLALAYSLHSELVFGACRRFARRHGPSSPAQEFLTGALAGTRTGCVATTEDHTGSNLAMIQTEATRDGDGWCLRGVKRYTTSGDIATDALVLARTVHGPTLFLVDLVDGQVRRSQPFDTMGMEPSNTVRLDFDEHLDDRRRLGPPGAGLLVIGRLLQIERLVAGLTSARLARESVLLAQEFLRRRDGPDGSLIDQPILRHRLAAAHATTASLEALADRVFDRACSKRVTDAEVAELKYTCARGACVVIDDMIQLMGGRGYTEHFPLSQWWRAARLMRIGGGTDEMMLDIIGVGSPDDARSALLDQFEAREQTHLYPSTDSGDETDQHQGER